MTSCPMDSDRSDLKMLNDRVEGDFRRASKVPQYFYSFAAALMTFCTGITIGWTSPSLPILESNSTSVSPSSITPDEGSWIGSLLGLGALFGALPAGFVGDAVGRKWFILVMALPVLASWLLIFFASTVAELYVARIIVGIVLGATSTTVPTYITEIAEDSVRGALSSCFQLFISLGVLYVYVAGAFLSYYTLLIVSIVPLIPFVLLFFNAPETPLFLIMRNKPKEAEMSLKRLRGEHYDIRKEFLALQALLKKETVSSFSFKQAILKRESVLGLIITLGLMIFQQLTCINVVVFYATSILAASGSSLNAYIATIIIGTAEPSSCLLSMATTDRIGRKILLIISAAATTIGLAVLGLYFYFKNSGRDMSSLGLLPTVIVWCHIFLFGVGYGPIPWMMAGEVLPNDVKGFGSGLAVAVNWGLAFGTTKAFQPMLDAIGEAATYWVFSASCFVGLIFCIFVVLETKGKSFQQIQNELKGTKKPVSIPEILIEMTSSL